VPVYTLSECHVCDCACVLLICSPGGRSRSLNSHYTYVIRQLDARADQPEIVPTAANWFYERTRRAIATRILSLDELRQRATVVAMATVGVCHLHLVTCAVHCVVWPTACDLVLPRSCSACLAYVCMEAAAESSRFLIVSFVVHVLAQRLA